MPGIRGLRHCSCDTNMVFGWQGEPRLLYDDFGDRIYGSVLTSIFGRKVHAVHAPYVVERNEVAVGATPKDYNGWEGSIPINDLVDSAFDAKYLTEIGGARAIYDTNGHNYVAYWTCKTYDLPAGSTLDWGDGSPSFMVGISTFDVSDPSSSVSVFLPIGVRIGPVADGYNWSSRLYYGGSVLAGGGYATQPTIIGFSRNSHVWVGYVREQDGYDNVARYVYSTGKWGVGYAESAYTDNGSYICLPAQMADGGNPWVLAKEYNSQAMVVGIWINNLCHTSDNPPAPGTVNYATSPAVLTANEVAHRLDTKPGFRWNNDDFQAWYQVAYTRRNGYDYVLVYKLDSGANRTYVYYDGRLEHWFRISGLTPNNIYAFENGDIVLANTAMAKYINADGTTRWTWESPNSNASASLYRRISLSGNSDWIQLKNVDIYDDDDIPEAHHQPSIILASTAPLDNRKWYNRGGSHKQPAVSLSRKTQSDGTPVCVVHRQTSRIIYGDTPNGRLPYSDARAYYEVNDYANLFTRKQKFDGELEQSHRAWLTVPTASALNFDCVTDCECACTYDANVPKPY